MIYLRPVNAMCPSKQKKNIPTQCRGIPSGYTKVVKKMSSWQMTCYFNCRRIDLA